MSLLNRLTQQVGSAAMARGLLIKRGHMTKDGKLTAEGKKRQALGNAGRAKDRAAKYSGHSPLDFTYNPKTNGTRLKKRKK
jgi:hypothetical protein